jgi:hypothetical protein
VSASCSAGLALFSGCAAQTDPALQSNAFAGSTESDTYSSRGQAVCVWTGGPVAVFATLTCTERVDWALVFGG